MKPYILAAVAILTLASCRDTIEYAQEAPLGYMEGSSISKDRMAELPWWYGRGVDAENYRISLDSTDAIQGSYCALISSEGSRGFGTLVRSEDPDKYKNRRLELTASLKTDLKDEYTWAGLWLRTDHGDSVLEFADMSSNDRKIRGKSDWKDYTLTVNVPQNTTNLAFGAILRGSGRLWVDNVRLISKEVIDSQYANLRYDFIASPENLDFEQISHVTKQTR